MTKTRNIVFTWIMSLMLSLMVMPVLAEDAEMRGLHCGDVVTITATPDAGYRFVSWSDGNTDNPREIEITEAVSLTAIYEPVCEQDEVPVIWLYNQLMMVNVDSLLRMGYTFSEQSVTWYHIVGDTDHSSHETNDQTLGTGYYYNLAPTDVGGYYAAVDVSQTPPSSVQLCSFTLYSRTIWVGASDLEAIVGKGKKNRPQKIIIDNQLYIIRDDQVYRADGSQVK